MKKRKSIRERLAEIIERDLGGTWDAHDIKQIKGPRWAMDICAWEAHNREKTQIMSYDTMTDIVKAGSISYVHSTLDIGPNEVSAKFKK